MSKGNPFILSSGRIPTHYIDRIICKREIIDSFTDEMPSNQTFIITGIRGCGKSVLMADIARTLKDEGFIVINLNIEGEMTSGFAAQLYDNELLQKDFIKAKIEISMLGLEVGVEKADKPADLENSVIRMMECVQKRGKRVLIVIDEVTSNAEMRRFGNLYSTLVRNDLPVFLVMTGLPMEVNSVINSRTLTFLTRAPKLKLEPVNYTAVRNTYEKVFGGREVADRMALLVQGYPFAFQLLGYLFWEVVNSGSKADITDVVDDFDAGLAEGAYEKIWSDMSDNEKLFTAAMAVTGSENISDNRERLEITPQSFNNTKRRLVEKCVLDETGHGKIRFLLPRFSVFVNTKILEENITI